MIYDLDSYRRSVFPLIKPWCDNRPDSTPLKEAGLIALSTECPIVVIAYYMTEIYGTDPELERFILTLETFYKVTEVRGKKVAA